jgi:hypothetical protein
LEGVRFAAVDWWPGPIHEGNGVWCTIVDEQATKDQQEAIVALASGQHGGTYWEVFPAVCPNRPEPLFGPITFKFDREKRHATVRVPDLIESDVEPIKNPVTGEEHRARSPAARAFLGN